MSIIGNMLVGFESVTCPQCGVMFGLPVRIAELWRRDEASFRCPNGHKIYLPCVKKQENTEFLKSEVQRLKDENVTIRQQLEQAEARVSVQAGKQKKRVETESV